jgi:hypothetical protein
MSKTSWADGYGRIYARVGGRLWLLGPAANAVMNGTG